MSKERYYINTQGNDDEAYREAMHFALELTKKGMDAKTVILLARTKQNVGWLERLFDRQTVKKLFRGLRFENSEPLFLIKTVKTYTEYSASNDIVIGMGLDSDDLMKLDDYYDVKAIISIPWLNESIQSWVKTWSPTDLRTKEKPTAFSMPEPIVQMAMKELTSNINMSTGIRNSFDNDRAKTYIRALHKYSVLDGEIVMAYLVRELGWDSDNATDVKKLIDTLNNGKYFKGGDKTYLKNHIKSWEEDVK
ncbi:hypothetical protein ACIGCP_11905 [Cellulophaga baltica]|uniref:hypothetical protein n=1 Tax=Cellulophaga baltica TaxID=76594 RepID=UPI0037C8CD54